MPTIELPNGWAPRSYQRPLWDYLERGGKRAIGIWHRRAGKDDSLPPRPVEKNVSNNVVLKKLRVAFGLKDHDVQQVFKAADFDISKPELSALCRQPGHTNFRKCGDQMLRNFLKGLTLRVRRK